MSRATRQSIMKRLLGTVLGLLCTQVCYVRGEQVEQSPPTLSLQEGASSTLRCNFSTSGSNLQWFRQNPGGHLISLFHIPSGTKQNGRLKAVTVAKERHSSLYISSSQTTDSAIYFCAVEPHQEGNYQLIWGSGTKLIIKPDIKDPKPAVYQLKSPKSSNTSVCLFTDFASQAGVPQVTGPEVFSSNSTALDMRATNSKSNGALAWSSRIGFQCNETFNETFYSSSGVACNGELIEKSFETDIQLNSQNLSVIVFRILLLKVLGFNLLMTLRLWSS
ncbi:PREDICTED: uncharacterized protein LOC101391383 [Ceratotherium simum simum]|uniref:Uncharacterized protein LOC101391383 n=1 Tax=Ceratotherium simum simum TaxID=73337 RepID=A0ABM1C8W0_CERSS|nr:PREDICTED: uncharacterized protein LOC101391383 [Ceratotherium simum simum]